jgi:8-oxo-dGTP pyrophosphatase MutT (NUDIX family)
MAAAVNGIRAAATVVLCRESRSVGKTGGFRCLMVKRSATARFFPGFSVFPGGISERSDEAFGAIDRTSGSGERGESEVFSCPAGEPLGKRFKGNSRLESINVAFDQAQQEPRG